MANDIEALKEAFWKKAEPFVYISREAFLRNFDGWEIEPIEHNGELIAITAVRGPEMHFQTTGKPIPRRIVHSVLQKIIDKHGYCLTKTPKEEARQHRFNRLIGFQQIGEDQYDIHYRVDTIMRDKNRSAECLS